ESVDGVVHLLSVEEELRGRVLGVGRVRWGCTLSTRTKHEGHELAPAGLQGIRGEGRGRRHPQAWPVGGGERAIIEGGVSISSRPVKHCVGNQLALRDGAGEATGAHLGLELAGKVLLQGVNGGQGAGGRTRKELSQDRRQGAISGRGPVVLL